MYRIKNLCLLFFLMTITLLAFTANTSYKHQSGIHKQIYQLFQSNVIRESEQIIRVPQINPHDFK
jgi:hypothetical protein